MNKLMQLVSDSEKAKVYSEELAAIFRQIQCIVEHHRQTPSIGGYQKIARLLESIPVDSSVNIYDEIAFSLNSFAGGVAGKRILDVGCDYGGQLVKAIALQGASEVIGVNPALTPKKYTDHCQICNIDIRHTSFPDNYFDCIVSISAFEHIHGLDIALNEMFRIMKPGGILFSRFGPIWSSSFGHHMWFTYRNQIYNYWNTFLPPFCHLLMNPKELLSYCQPLFGEDVGIKIVEYIFGTSEQNRYLFCDYDRLINNSHFRTLFFTGYTASVLHRLYIPDSWPKTLQTLLAQRPENDNFKHDGLELLLIKP